MTFGSYPAVVPSFSSCIKTASYRAHALRHWTYVPVRRIIYLKLCHETVIIIRHKRAIVAEGNKDYYYYYYYYVSHAEHTLNNL
jgi:hypothetical protein